MARVGHSRLYYPPIWRKLSNLKEDAGGCRRGGEGQPFLDKKVIFKHYKYGES